MNRSLAFLPKLVLLLSGALLLASCSPLIEFEQPALDGYTKIVPGIASGQTFRASFDGLEGIAVYLKPLGESPPRGRLRLHLQSVQNGLIPFKGADLATADLPLDPVAGPGFYRFSFPPLLNSNQQDYIFRLELLEGDGVALGTGPGRAYLNGASYTGTEPQEEQLTFRLVYRPRQVLFGLLQEGIPWLGYLLAAAFLLLPPGWALLAWLWRDWPSLHWAARASLAGGVSLAIYPLFILWTGLVGLHLGPLYAWLPPLLGIAALLIRGLVSGPWKSPTRNSPLVTLQKPQFKLHVPRPALSDLTLAIVIALLLFTRLWAARDLTIPMWGDSYQHTMMAQLLVDHGGLFDSWQPYAELQTFTYHFGLHAQVAAFHWLTGLPAPQAMLWYGQILNALAALFLFPLALRLSHRPWAGVAAVALAGLVFPMPAYYLNWGRYTQLAGQAILPAALALGWANLEAPASIWKERRGETVAAWIVLAGLALTHYRVLILAGLFFVAFFAIYGWVCGGRNLAARSFWLLAGAGLLSLPWYIHLFAGQLVIFFAQVITSAPAAPVAAAPAASVGNLFFYLPPLTWLMLPLALAWAIWQRRRPAVVIGLWWLLVFWVANPQWLHLPGGAVLGETFGVAIAFYIPAALLLGASAGWLLPETPGAIPAAGIPASARLRQVLARAAPALLALAVLGLVVWGARQRLKDADLASSALVTPPDLRAAAWIQANTPPGARFLVNSFFAYNGSSIVGSDAGLWLPLLAHRPTMLPPLTYSSERGPRPDYQAWTNILVAAIQDRGILDPDSLALLQERGIGYVYIGQRQGELNSPGPLFQPEELLSSPHFKPVYHQDRVWVFQITP